MGNEHKIKIRGWKKSSEADQTKVGRSLFKEGRPPVLQLLHWYLWVQTGATWEQTMRNTETTEAVTSETAVLL